MSADIDSQHLLLEGQLHLLGVFAHIRHFYFKVFLLVLGYNIEKRHLPCHIVLFVMDDPVHDLHIGTHKLFPGSGKAVKSPCLNKILNGLFIDFLVHYPCNEIFQVHVRSPEVSLLHHHIDHRPAYTFDGGQGIADSRITIHRKSALSLVDIRRQNRNSHIPAYHDVFCHFVGVINYRGHESRHELYRVIVL